MNLHELYQKLQSLESHKQSIELELLQTKKLIEQLSPFSKEQKIELFKSLFVGRSDVFAKYWISKDGLKKGMHQWLILLKGMIIFQSTMKLFSSTLKVKLEWYLCSFESNNGKVFAIDLDKASFIEDIRAIIF